MTATPFEKDDARLATWDRLGAGYPSFSKDLPSLVERAARGAFDVLAPLALQGRRVPRHQEIGGGDSVEDVWGEAVLIALFATRGETWTIVETDNFGGDYPDETFVAVGFATNEEAHAACGALNDLRTRGEDSAQSPRILVVKPSTYRLQPRFAP